MVAEGGAAAVAAVHSRTWHALAVTETALTPEDASGRLLAGRVVIATGDDTAGTVALELARHGAQVILNRACAEQDPGAGDGPDAVHVLQRADDPVRVVVADHDDADRDGATALLAEATDRFGRVDAVVSTAIPSRSQLFVQSTAEEWDTVIRRQLRSRVLVGRLAATFWSERAKEVGPVDGRLVSVVASIGAVPPAGQAAASTAAAASIGLVLAQAVELRHYGVTANAVCLGAAGAAPPPDGARAEDPKWHSGEAEAPSRAGPGNAATLVAWLCSGQARHVTGRVFEVRDRRLSLMCWTRTAAYEPGADPAAFDPGPVVDRLLAGATEHRPTAGA